jgi:polyferredoxin
MRFSEFTKFNKVFLLTSLLPGIVGFVWLSVYLIAKWPPVEMIYFPLFFIGLFVLMTAISLTIEYCRYYENKRKSEVFHKKESEGKSV